MSYYLLQYLEPMHYHPWSDVGVTSRADVLNRLQLPNFKGSVVLCCHEIMAFIDEIHNMPQVIKIYKCKTHCPSPDNVLWFSDYPKVKEISLDERNFDGKPLANHIMIATSDTSAESVEHCTATDNALDSTNFSWRSLALLDIAAAYDTPAEYTDHIDALVDALNLAKDEVNLDR